MAVRTVGVSFEKLIPDAAHASAIRGAVERVHRCTLLAIEHLQQVADLENASWIVKVTAKYIVPDLTAHLKNASCATYRDSKRYLQSVIPTATPMQRLLLLNVETPPSACAVLAHSMSPNRCSTLRSNSCR